jgi:hypothetical protein
MKKLIFTAILAAVVLTGCSLSSKTAKVITPEQAKAKVADFINKNLMQAGNEVTVKDIVEENGLYKTSVILKNGQTISSYITKDGTEFFPQVMNIAEIEKQNATKNTADASGQNAQQKTIPKTDKPVVELFVMAFCPYGVQAEKAMQPVVDLLGKKADIKVRYIVSLSGSDMSTVSSLHGVIEGKEDARQLCVAKNYDQKSLWKYISGINTNCVSVYNQGEDVFNTCWKKEAKAAGVDSGKVEKCYNSEAVKLINNETTLDDKYSVSGSPTLVINGVQASGDRTPDGYKTSICNAFKTKPAECSKTLSSDAAAAAGNCGN